jgi:uncharacterized caspase-like protein
MSRLLPGLLAVVAIAIALMGLPGVALAQKRVALVVGNSAYKYAGELPNPKNDATDVAAALNKHGFKVLEGYDLDKAAFDRKIRDFANELTGAETGVFFYAGHGLSVDGRNYLIPTDAELKTAVGLDFETVQVDVIHRVMERQTTTNILFLDACRDNPLSRNLARSLGTRSAGIGKGLAPVESGVGTLISFSTQPGNVALDGAGRNSPFAGALVKHLGDANSDLSAILIAVRNDVMRDTQRAQVPWEHSALTGRFYFSPPKVPEASSPKLPELPSNAIASDLFTEADLARATALAAKKALPVPSFKILKPGNDVPEKFRRFVGIWISDAGFQGSDRQWMTIVVSVTKAGKVFGYHSRGPPMPNSFQNPAAVIAFTALIAGGSASYKLDESNIELSFVEQGRLLYREMFQTGGRVGSTATAKLNPVWTLLAAEKKAKR